MVTQPSTSPSLSVVFFGTPDFAVPTLEMLLRSRHGVVGVVTQPDRPSGRGQKTRDAPVKALAVAAGVPVLQPVRLKDAAFVERLTAMHADCAVVAAYGKILPADVLTVPRRGLLNVHASLLPQYRGAAPVHRAVIAGERETGVTIMRMVQALDAGPVLAHVRRPIAPEETSEQVERDLARLGGTLLVATLDRLAVGDVPEVAQDDRMATYARKLTKDDGIVDWSWPAERLHNLVRGLHPWPHAFSFLDGHRVILRRTRWSPQPTSSATGSVVDVSSHRLVVATGLGLLEVVELQPEGRRPMTARDFLAGHVVAPGSRFGPA